MVGRDNKRRPIAITLLAIFFFLGNAGLVAATGHCQPVTGTAPAPGGYPAITLDSPWKIRQADSPEFSSPLYNDADWQTIQVPANAQELFPSQSGYLWYRKWVYILPGKPLYDLGIRLGKIASADVTYVNGYLIGGSGSPQPDGLDNRKIRIYPIPAAILSADGHNLVAVRVKRYYTDLGGMYSEPVRIGGYSQLVNQLIRAESVDLVFSGVFILLGAALFVFSLRRRTEKELFFFGLSVFTLGLYTFYTSQWRYLLNLETVYDTRFYYAAGFTVIPAFARFAYVYLADRSRQEKTRVEKLFDYASQGMLWFAGMADFLLWVYYDQTTWHYFDEFIYFYLCLLFSGIAGLYSLYKFAAGTRDSKLLVFMFILVFVSVLAETIRQKINLPDNIVMWGVMVLVLVSIMAIANRFFRLQDEVREYSAGLEKMVDIRTRQLKAMEESRSRLLANISHDLRTPVSSVLGHAELLLEEIVDSPDQQRGYIKRIHANMLGFNRLIQDLFELAKIESQQERFHMAPVAAVVLVENVYQKYLYDVQNAGLAFENQCSLSSAVRVLADKDRLDQVFANLIGNALRYTSPGGLIAIGCRVADKPPDGLTPADNGSSGLVCFTVADDGTGIEPEQAPHIFERFYRGNEAARTNPSEHSGLGLAIAKEIILAHNGRIWVDAAVKRGCTIHFVLPVIEE